MKRFVAGPLADHPHNLLRRIGYAAHVGRDQQASFVKRIHQTPYPRYHVYVSERGGGMEVSLHLDQKQHSYEGAAHAHSGDYEGPTVEREMKRILDAIAGLARAHSTQTQTNKPPPKKEWWDILLGR